MCIPKAKPTQPPELSAAHLSAGTTGRHRFPPQGAIGSAAHGIQDPPAHLGRGCQRVFPFRRERRVLRSLRGRNMERTLAENGDVDLDTYQTAPWNARLCYRMVLNDPMLSVSIHLKPANRPEKIKWCSISGPILVISISKGGNTHLNLGASTERWPPKSIQISGSGGYVLLRKWLELPQKLPSVPGKAWKQKFGAQIW